MTAEYDWLAELKVGDKVAIQGAWDEKLGYVERVTARYLIVGRQRFRRCDGAATASKMLHLEPFDAAAEDRLLRRQLYEWLQSLCGQPWPTLAELKAMRAVWEATRDEEAIAPQK